MTTLELLYKHKEQIVACASGNGIRNVRIFGSVAKGLDHSESDVDFLVQIEDGRTLFDLIRFKQSVEELLGRKVDVVSDQAVHHTLKQYILDEVVQL
jgi:predicted nucleotidyltransferase